MCKYVMEMHISDAPAFERSKLQRTCRDVEINRSDRQNRLKMAMTVRFDVATSQSDR